MAIRFADFLKNECQKEYYRQLMKTLDMEYANGVVYPPRSQWFRAFELIEGEIKVVIIGQDPYFNFGEADGLAFSVANGVRTPPSLQNIFKELQDDLGVRRVNSDLTNWAKQGVLLLNSVLTVKEKLPLSHKNIGWEHFTMNFINMLNDSSGHLVFVLWGENAKKYRKNIDTTRHLIIESSHPSPLSARHSFFGSKPFSRINQFLKEHQIKEIDWSK